MLFAALLLTACGGGGSSSGHPNSGFPGTPAGAQAGWLLGAVAHAPIPDASIRAHFDSTFLALVPPGRLNQTLQGVGEPRLLSITTSEADRLVFLVAISGGRRFQVTLEADSRGLIDGLLFSAPSAPSSGADVPALAPGWVAQPVTFAAAGMPIYGTYTHPRTASARVPGALLIQGSGDTDRNDNEPGFVVNTLAAVADWLSQDGVATLRYDKLASGETGAGPYAAHPDTIGIAPYEQEAAAALRFLADQSEVDPSRLAVVGHSEGGLYALLLATGLAGKAPRVHALVLLESQSLPILDHIRQQVTAQVTAQQRAGAISAAQARTFLGALSSAIAQVRTTGRLTGTVPGGLAATFNSGTALYLHQDSFDPAVIAASLAPQTPVLLTCSNDDFQVSCADVDHLAGGLARAHAIVDFVHLVGVDHVLKEDSSRTSADYTQPLPFSSQLRAALRAFASAHL